MRRLSAQYIITNSGKPLRRAVITTGDDGTVTGISEENGLEREIHSLEFYNGIIVPGFINCHCHLELSHLKGLIPEGTGLPEFIMKIRSERTVNESGIITAMEGSDAEMYNEGVVMCADICNSSVSFGLKKKSRIRYLNLLEVFGIDPEKARKRIDEISELASESRRQGLQYSVVPHSPYSLSVPLFKMLRQISSDNRVTSIHFMESDYETRFLNSHDGPLRDSYEQSGILPGFLDTPLSHEETIMNLLNPSGNLILVHNTFADATVVRNIMQRGSTFWCLCPGSNKYITGLMPPVKMLRDEGCEIVIGTDSPASNRMLSLLYEMKLIQDNFRDIGLEELIRWATLNGARALCADDELGTIEPGKKPGLLLLEGADLEGFKLLPGTTVKRLV
ncbi:MAG: amidohydrolase family protein [Bacteroidales bacterium]|nr:amidohydrolase family protein [Bacteroidales bacterium]MBN2633030.1 amidohydrolase family protein [Bacteroidales bacterium]